MAQEGVTKFDSASKHILFVGLGTFALGMLAALFIPSVGGTSSLNFYTAGGVIVAAMLGAAITAHNKIGNWLIAGIMTAGATTIVGALLFQAWSQPFEVVGVVGVGSFLFTILSKWYHKRKHGH